MDIEKQIKNLVKFTSAIWQIHPFIERNTRTVAVFIQKYLLSMGYDVNNDLFKAFIRKKYKLERDYNF